MSDFNELCLHSKVTMIINYEDTEQIPSPENVPILLKLSSVENIS